MISGEIAKLLKKGVIKEYYREKVTTVFIRTKKDGGMCNMLNLKN